MAESVKVIEQKNKVIISTPGPQGPRGRTILNGTSAPANNLGLTGDFYFNSTTSEFYGPKLEDSTWAGAGIILLASAPENFSYSWEMSQITGPVSGVYSVVINHNLGFNPNVSVKSSSGDMLETGIDYNSTSRLTLTMAQPFSGTAYLS
jgi:hypothetical protein